MGRNKYPNTCSLQMIKQYQKQLNINAFTAFACQTIVPHVLKCIFDIYVIICLTYGKKQKMHKEKNKHNQTKHTIIAGRGATTITITALTTTALVARAGGQSHVATLSLSVLRAGRKGDPQTTSVVGQINNRTHVV